MAHKNFRLPPPPSSCCFSQFTLEKCVKVHVVGVDVQVTPNARQNGQYFWFRSSQDNFVVVFLQALDHVVESLSKELISLANRAHFE
jgi:hypothetical protein